jgi:hypothetical protein
LHAAKVPATAKIIKSRFMIKGLKFKKRSVGY